MPRRKQPPKPPQPKTRVQKLERALGWAIAALEHIAPESLRSAEGKEAYRLLEERDGPD